MPHEIDVSTGSAAVLVAGEPPWHGLGTVIQHAAGSQQALQLAHLDWTVESWPLWAGPQNQPRPVTTHVANVRSDTQAVLGVVSRRYRIFQNREAFSFMDILMGEKLAMYETAGSLQGGRRVWLLARIPEEFRVGTEDVVQPYVLLCNNHDGLAALRMIPTSVRVVCSNTLNLALQGQDDLGITIRHCESLPERVLEARRSLGIVTRRFAAFKGELQVLGRQTVNSAWLGAYFSGLLPTAADPTLEARQKLIRTAWQENFENPRNTLPGIRSTAWAAFNAVSEWADHQRKFRGTDPRIRAERRLQSVWFGASDQLKRRAYDAALAARSN